MNEYTGKALSWKGEDGVIELALNRAPANEIGLVMLDDLERFTAALPELESQASALILYSKQSSGFSAGADLRELYTLAQQSTNVAYFHSTGTSTATIGTNPPFTVTNYVANTPNETILGCNNSGSGSLSKYSVSLGTPKGSNFELVVSSTFVGSIFSEASGTTTTFDFTYQTTAFTIA